MRLALAVLAASVAATIGALIMGEYELTPMATTFAAIAFGFAIGEVVAAISRRHGLLETVIAAAITAGGLVWAVMIASGMGLLPVPLAGRAAPVVGAAVAAATVRSSGPGAGRSRNDA